MYASKEENTIKVSRIECDGMLSIAHINVETSELISTSASYNINDLANWQCFIDDKVRFKSFNTEEISSAITLMKIDTPEYYAAEISTINDADKNGIYIFTKTQKQRERILIIPDTAMTRCQNCDTYFPTKYQYQRHQCEFNAEKIVLKSEVAGQEIDKVIRMKFECEICKKSFVSYNNLERHKSSHSDNKLNTCEFCNKSFVSDNRLRIHKENHCKKAGDMTKFYRSDVIVWSCLKCNRIFANEQSGNKHIETCTETKHWLQKIQIKNDNEEVLVDLSKKSSENENNFDTNFENEIRNQTLGFYKDAINTNLLEKTLTEMLYQCEFCNRTYASKENVLDHQKTHATDKNYECIFCNESFNAYNTAVVHWQGKCNDESNLFYLPKMIYCELCDRGYKSHEILYSHKNKKKHFTSKIHEKKTDLSESKNDEKAIVKFIQDMIIKYEKNGQQFDIVSNNECETKAEEKMQNKEVEEKPIVETGKKKRGRKRKNIKQEVKNKKKLAIENGFKYQCEKCGSVFDDISLMDTHKESEHISTYNCEECGQVVHSAKALMIHSRAHQFLKPYVCDQCGRSYSQTSHLWQHMRFHQGIKPFACPHEGCEARYTIRPDLKDHIRKVHTRERPFKCSVCQKCFLTGSVYYQHRLIHTNDRRYGCEICNKRFFRADALNNHRRIHTDERPYPCPICGREFRQKGDRNKHVRTQHPM